MKITAITRYKHAELARRCGLDPGRVAEVININKRPSQKTADAIQKALGEAGEYFDVIEQWPETFEGIRSGTRKEETMEVPMECLLGCREAMMLPAPEQRSDNGLEAAMEECLETLTEREKRVLEARFYESKTLEDVAKEFGLVSRDRIRQIEAKALRKLRHPTRIRNLERFAGAFSA